MYILDGLQSYNMPQGLKRGDLDFSDRIYDGTEDSGYLSHGLGQLTDGIKGKDNFKLDLKGHGKGGQSFRDILRFPPHLDLI